jgi:adenylosuccinate synthase
MGELKHLAAELRANDTIEQVVEGTTGALLIDIDHGEYDSMTSEVVTILGRYDAEIYYGMEKADIIAVPP